MRRSARVGLLLLALLVGVLIGMTGAFVQAHRSVWLFDGRYVVIPWGAVIVVVVLLLAIRAAATLTGLRAAAWLLLGGWVAMTVFLASETAGGDIAVSSGARQIGYLFGGVILGAMVATFPARSMRGKRASGVESAAEQGNPAAGSRVGST